MLEQEQQKFNKKTDQLSVQIREVEKRETRLEWAFELSEDNFNHMEDEAREVHNAVENIDNSMWRNNQAQKPEGRCWKVRI